MDVFRATPAPGPSCGTGLGRRNRKTGAGRRQPYARRKYFGKVHRFSSNPLGFRSMILNLEGLQHRRARSDDRIEQEVHHVVADLRLVPEEHVGDETASVSMR